MMPQIVDDGMGEVKYLVFDPDDNEPWVGDLPTLLDTIRSFDVARIFLIMPDTSLHEVHVESTDGDPDYEHWEVTLLEGGELVERGEYVEAEYAEQPSKLHIVRQHVNGFIAGV